MLGARQVGKTTLLKTLFEDTEEVLWLNGDEMDIQALFDNISASRLKAIFGNKKTIIIDEAQRIKDIGLRMKLITDQIPEVQLVVTGSSAFELANKLNEPLTGRKWEYKMFPLSFAEMAAHHGLLEEKRMVAHRMVYGYYPEVINNVGIEKEILKQLSNSYLYKDVLLLEQIKKPEGLIKLLQGLAFQAWANPKSQIPNPKSHTKSHTKSQISGAKSHPDASGPNHKYQKTNHTPILRGQFTKNVELFSLLTSYFFFTQY